MRGEAREHLGQGSDQAFQKLGWEIRGQVGSHVVMTKSGVRVNLTVPQHPELAPGTLRSLIRTAGISVEDFLQVH